MTAQPVHAEDPCDPEQILARLPERERDQFLREYRAAAEAAAHEVWRYKELQALLHRWSLIAIAVNKPGYYEDLEAAKSGTLETVPIEDALAQLLGMSSADATSYWQEKVEAARIARQTER